MKTSDQIIIEELKRIVLMQSQEITRLITKISVLERELSGYTTKKDSNNSSIPSSKDENRPPRTSSLREKGNRKAGGQHGHEGKTMVSFQKRITKYKDHVFTFLYHPNVPPDNNGSERAIRNIKVKQKISGEFKILNAAEI